MQPDTTPDLDELERLHAAAALAWRRGFTASVAGARFADVILGGNAMPFLLRAARERDAMQKELETIRSCAFMRLAWAESLAEHYAPLEAARAVEEMSSQMESLQSDRRKDARELDELRVEVEAWREKPWADQLRAQSARISQLMARAEKAEADLAESKRLVEKAEARAKAGELLASQVLDLMEWLDALADRCDEDLENEARASIGSLALTAASAKAEEIIAGPDQGEVLSEKYAEELVRRTRALAQKEPKP